MPTVRKYLTETEQTSDFNEPIAFIRDSLNQWAEARQIEGLIDACEVIVRHFERFFQSEMGDADIKIRVSGDWRFKKLVYTAAAFTMIELAEFGLRQAWVVSGLRPLASSVIWPQDIYCTVCDFAGVLTEAIGLQMVQERKTFRQTERNITLH